jgi:hypothetical protein
VTAFLSGPYPMLGTPPFDPDDTATPAPKGAGVVRPAEWLVLTQQEWAGRGLGAEDLDRLRRRGLARRSLGGRWLWAVLP